MASRIFPVILCGGSGTRLWPMSRKLLPKQFLPLASERTMLQETALRPKGLADLADPIIVCGEEHRFLAGEQLREVGVKPARIILEPAARNTAPAVAAAAMAIAGIDADGIALVLPADHLIRDASAFRAAVVIAAEVARRGLLATFGIVPTAPETGFGYIQRGDRLQEERAFRVERFVEKPDIETAKRFLASGGFFWNSGMFVFKAGRYLQELSRLAPDIHAAVTQAWDKRAPDADFCRLDKDAFTACRADSIDYAVMEKTADAAVVEARMGWSDVGSWATLWDVSAKDGEGNAVQGDIDLHDVENCYIRADGRLVSVIGVADLMIVETADAVLVAHRDRAQSVKEVVARLESNKRTEHLHHRRVYRPWGYYENIDSADRYQVKRIMVKPGEALSLQLHHHRAEHWVVVSGEAHVTRGEEEFTLVENESTYIPVNTKHRLENAGTAPLFLVEVQSGAYLGEDDIVRFEDRYRRS